MVVVGNFFLMKITIMAESSLLNSEQFLTFYKIFYAANNEIVKTFSLVL